MTRLLQTLRSNQEAFLNISFLDKFNAIPTLQRKSILSESRQSRKQLKIWLTRFKDLAKAIYAKKIEVNSPPRHSAECSPFD